MNELNCPTSAPNASKTTAAVTEFLFTQVPTPAIPVREATRTPSRARLQLTPFQRIFHNEWLLDPSGSRYNMVLDQILSGTLDIDRLNRSLIRFVNNQLLLSSNVLGDERHPCWIQRDPIPRGAPLLVYHPEALSEGEILAIVTRPFDLQNDLLARFHAIRLTDGRIRIIYIIHHIVIDGSSFRAIHAECSRYYNEPGYSNPISIAEQRRLHAELCSHLNQIVSENQAQMDEFWRRHLEGVSGEDLSFLRNALTVSPQIPASPLKNRVGEFRFHFKNSTLARVKQLRRLHKLTPYLFGQIVFGMLLYRLGGKKCIGISFPVAIPEGTELIYGAHINNLVMDFRFDEDTTMADLIERSLEYHKELKALRARYLPVYEIMRHASGESLLDASFVQTDLKDVPMRYEGIDQVEVRHDLNVDLPNKLLFEQELLPDRLNYRVRFDREVFDTELVRKFIDVYRALFHEVLDSLLNAQPHRKITEYPLLRSSQYDQIIRQWNATDQAWPSEKTVHGLFEEQVRRTPEQVALVFEDVRLTYRELNERANQLASCLQTLHFAKPDGLVALCLERSENMIIAILAVLKAGAAYVPLDPANPDGRIEFILADTGALTVLTDQANRDRFKRITTNTSIALECIDSAEMRAALASQPATNPVSGAQPSNLFYVVYTSGTTDRPKGVMIEHRQVTPIIDAIREAYNFDKPSRITAFTSFGFDVSSSEFFVSLLNGGELHLLPERLRKDIGALSDYLNEKGIEFAYLPPAVLAVLPKIEYPCLTTIIYAGEPCDLETGRYWSSRKRLFNFYGPTETNIATGKLIQHGEVHLIGRPVANAKVYILDQRLSPLPVGAMGEIYIGGAAVARGYLNRSELTNERFVANPFQTAEEAAENRNSRLYKSGDLARYLPDGDLEFVGRNDHQIKIRGYRIELGEIQAQLAHYPGIEQAVVIVRERVQTRTKYLAAYYVAPEAIDEQSLSAHLRNRLPEHMVPTVVLRIDRVPLTINGKVDGNALPASEPACVRSVSPPENTMQEQLCALYAEILDLEHSQIGIDDDFFRLGGTSILSFRLISQLRTVLNVAMSPAVLFTSRTIRQLSQHIEKGGDSGVRIHARPTASASCPLSFAQERLWFIHSFQGASNVYNIPVALRLKPSTCVESFLKALASIVQRHEVLRSYVRTNAEGVGCQWVESASDFPWTVERIRVASKREMDEEVDRSFGHSFNLEQELPIKVTVFELIEPSESSEPVPQTVGADVRRLSSSGLSERSEPCRLGSPENDEYSERLCANATKSIVVSLVIHHIAFDGWSAGILIRELLGFYQAHEAVRIGGPASPTVFSPEPLKLQYKDFAAWQRGYLTGDLLAAQLEYWKNQLSGCEPLQLPLDRPRPSSVDYAGANIGFELDPQTSEQLRAIARDLEVSLHSVLLGGYYLLLSSFSNQKDIVVGIPIANRHHAELQDTIGFFVNTLALRQTIDPAESIATFIQRVGHSVIQAQQHQDLPFEKLVSELNVRPDSSRHPLFQVMFGLQEHGAGPATETLFEIYQTPRAKRNSPAKFDLTTMLSDRGLQISGTFNYATSLFEETTVLSFINTYKEILSQIAALGRTSEANQTIRDLHYLSAVDEQKVIRDWNATQQAFPEDKTVHQLIEEQVERAPENVAVLCGSNELTYRQLNERSNQLAHYLLETYAIGPDDRVALLLERSEHLLIAMLAVLKAGAAYVPIDPKAPRERIGHLLQDSGARVLLAHQATANSAADGMHSRALAVVVMDSASLGQALSAHPVSNPITATKPHHLCYVIYTSGTTGQPKGVMVEHRNLVNFVWHKRTFLSKEDVVASYINYTFDAINSDLYPALLNGNTVFLLGHEHRSDVSLLFAFLVRHPITFLVLPAAVANELCHFDLSQTRLKTLVTGGDVFTDAHKCGPIRCLNEYGPTETTVCATLHSRTKGCDHNTIGRPIPNVTAYVLDSSLTPLPVGAVGELFIGGVGVARGYLNQPKLTRERFIANPFQTRDDKTEGRNGRLYRTGDLVRYWPNGDLEFLGRNDCQIKIRGYRIEPGEIEARMASFAGIKQAVVVARQREKPGPKYLAAYYVTEERIDEGALTAFLGKHLPDYMVPSVLVRLEKLPLTPTGKVDRNALPEPVLGKTTEQQEPENATQERLREIYAAALGLDAQVIGIDDDFFSLGGNSLLAVKLVTKINQALNTSMSVSAIFTCKTIRKLSVQLPRRSQIVRLNETRDKDNLFMIHPALGGCEVYGPLSEALQDHFCCFGVDSYNLYHTETIGDLKTLARYYLACIDEIQSQSTKTQYRLLGWSLGGQIALEIAAALEARGVKDITVFLLDTVLRDERLRAAHPEPTDENIRQAIERTGNVGVHADNYRQYFVTESQLSDQSVSRTLAFTKVILLKAMESIHPNGTPDELDNHVRRLESNNVERTLASVEQLRVVKVHGVNHWDLLSRKEFIASQIICCRSTPGTLPRRSVSPSAEASPGQLRNLRLNPSNMHRIPDPLLPLLETVLTARDGDRRRENSVAFEPG